MDGNTLVLFDKIDIGKNLFEKFKEIYPNKSVFYSDGQTKVQDREKIREDFEKSDGNILFSNV
jgi:transcription-repair coupling factor (superfamily II helicase)